MVESATKTTARAARAWQRVSPLSLVFFVADLAKTLARNFVQVGVPLVAFLVSTGGFTRERLTMVGIAIVAVTLLYAVARYINTRFRFGESGVVLRTGVFSRSELNVDYERIQALNLSQNPIYRWFGLYDLSIDSAGSVDNEIVLPAVSDAVVEALRCRLEQVGAASAQPAVRDDDDDVLIRLSDPDMVRIGISSERSLVFLAVIGSAFGAVQSQDWTENLIGRLAPDWISDVQLLTLSDWLLYGLAVLAAVVAFILALSIVGAFVRFFRFTLAERNGELVSRAGLVTVRTQTLPLRKAQRVDVVRGLVHRWLGSAEISVQQAAGKEHQEKGEFVVPLVDDRTLPAVAQRVLDDNATGFLRSDARGLYRPIHRYYWFARWRVVGVAPALLAGALFYISEQPTWLLGVPVAWFVITALAVWQSYRRWGYYVFADGIAIRRGLLGERIETMLWRKMQYVTLRETPFLARKGLCHLIIATAAGQRRLPFVPRDLAVRFADRALYRAESDSRSWI